MYSHVATKLYDYTLFMLTCFQNAMAAGHNKQPTANPEDHPYDYINSVS